MAKLFLVNIDLSKNQLVQARIENLASAPASPGVGQVYHDTTLGYQRQWDGAAWQRGSYLTDVYDRANHTGTQTAATISNFDTQVRTSRLDQMAVPTADLNINSRKLTNVTAGTNPNDAVVRSQLDAVSTGLDVKASVRVASTANVAVTYNNTGGTSARGQITAAPNALDGITLVAGDRILLKDQTTGAANGIWTVTTVGTGANGVWDRATDFDSDAEVTPGAFTFVEEGTTNADSGWTLTTNAPITIGGATGTALVWAQFTGAGSITAGAGLTKTGNTIDVGAGAGIAVAADTVAIDTAVVVRKYAVSFGDGAALAYTITHNLGTADVTVAVYDNSSPFAEVFCDVEHATANTVILRFATAPSANRYRCVVHG